MNPNILGVIGPGFLNQVPTLSKTEESPNAKVQASGVMR